MNKNSLSTALFSATIRSLAALALVFSASATVAANQDNALRAYRAQYQISHDGISAKAERSLSKKGEHWRLSQTARLFFFSVEEESLIAQHEGQLRPLSYRYDNSVSSKKNMNLRFDWQDFQVADSSARKPWQLPLKPHYSDQLSAQLQLRELLLKGQLSDNFEQTIVKRKGKLKTYQISAVGEEEIDTALGRLSTIKLRKHRPGSSAEAYVWLAPSLDYLIVKLEQREDDELYTMNILSAKFEPGQQ